MEQRKKHAKKEGKATRQKARKATHWELRRRSAESEQGMVGSKTNRMKEVIL
jgi:hypothetical protein